MSKKIRKPSRVLVIPIVAAATLFSFLALKWQWLTSGECIAIVVTGIGSLVAILIVGYFAWRQVQGQLQTLEKDRHSDLILRFCERWDSPRLIESRQHISQCITSGKSLADHLEECEKHDVAEFLVLIGVADFFEDMAFLVRNDYLGEIKLVEGLFGASILLYHDYYSRHIEKHRKDGVYEHFDWLATSIKGMK
jgi:hypothetical protein